MNRRPCLRPRAGALAAFLLALILLPALAGAYGLADALREMYDPATLMAPADPPRRAVRFSSTSDGPFDAGRFLREEGIESVMLDIGGPGVLTRLWADEPMGYLRFYFDGAAKPQFECLWTDLAAGRFPPMEPPFVQPATGGTALHFPMPFAKGLRITLSGQTWCAWSADAAVFAPATPVTTWTPRMKPPAGVPRVYTEAATAWEDTAAIVPDGEVTSFPTQSLSAGSKPVVYTAAKDELVTEIAWTQLEGTLSADLYIHLAGIEVPWRQLCGSHAGMGDFATRYAGRSGRRSWLRVPFLLKAGERVEFAWRGGAEGEALGRSEIRTKPIPEGAAPELLPRLWVTQSERKPGRIGEPAWTRGAGRVLFASIGGSAHDPRAIDEMDFSLRIDGSPHYYSSSSLADLAGTAKALPNVNYSCALSARRSGDFPAAFAIFPGIGVPFAAEVVPKPGWAPEVFAHALQDIVLVGYSFGDDAELVQLTAYSPTVDHGVANRIVSAGTDDTGLPACSYIYNPIAVLTPTASDFTVGPFIEGMFVVDVVEPGLDELEVRLDLPLGWKGTLGADPARHLGEGVEVFDIGWPPLAFASPATGTIGFFWTATPPAHGAGGTTIIQFRATSRKGGVEFTTREQYTIESDPTGERIAQWRPGAPTVQSGDRATTLTMPTGVQGLPGDLLVAEWAPGFSAFDTYGMSTGRLRLLESTIRAIHAPRGQIANARGYADDIAPLLPPDGVTTAPLTSRGETRRAVLPVGRWQSWLGYPSTIGIEPILDGADLGEFVGAALYRRPPHPKADGWTKRVPYVESPENVFHLPRARAMLSGNALRLAMRLVMNAPDEQIEPLLRPADFLENVEAGPLGWRLAEPPRRGAWLKPSHSMEFRARHTGSRIAIHDDRIKGARFFGFEFGYGPRGGTVGVRDCEGRLVAVQDLWLPQDRALPQYTWVALPFESRDGWIYLESLGPTPGGLEQHIALQKFFIFEDEKVQ